MAEQTPDRQRCPMCGLAAGFHDPDCRAECAEVERLRGEADHAAHVTNVMDAANDDLQAEIERLQAWINDLREILPPNVGAGGQSTVVWTSDVRKRVEACLQGSPFVPEVTND